MTKLGLPELTGPFRGGSGIPNRIVRLSVATRTYHLTKDDDTPMSYNKKTIAVAAARRTLMLPVDLSDGAGAP
eukprot:8060357-Pyramimonas_sp.AAC.1